jgi:hypothetical protein
LRRHRRDQFGDTRVARANTLGLVFTTKPSRSDVEDALYSADREVSSAAPSSRRTVVREDWALVAVVCGAGWGGDWAGSSWSIPIVSVVPMSL